jgi:lysine 2,3-aminomutase
MPNSQHTSKNGELRTEAEVFRGLVDEDGRGLCADRDRYLAALWHANPEIHAILAGAADLELARSDIYSYLERTERTIFSRRSALHVLRRATIRECVRALRSIIGPHNEEITGVCALRHLWNLARGQAEPEVSNGFVLEFIHLFCGLSGKSNIYEEEEEVLGELPKLTKLEGREAAQNRVEVLDAMATSMDWFLRRYPSGLDQEVQERRSANRARIIARLGATEQAWADPSWHLDHVIKQASLVEELVGLTAEERDAADRAVRGGIPFGITPYYLSLMDSDRSLGFDRAVRSQVLPPLDYVEQMLVNRADRAAAHDFMGEADTSPVDLITRRYPRIAILKPYNTCSQICVYCQRNWEIDECMAPEAAAPEQTLSEAINWLKEHPAVGEVLITGGDPCVMPDQAIEELLERVSRIEHVYRIRIGTRTPVVLPMRWTDRLADLIAKYHEPGRREVVVVTHFEHPYEVTPEAMQAVQQIRKRGLSVYNQQVFNMENSRRFETVKLRLVLRSIGVDPYYTFNMKGKDETQSLMVPIARLLQERKEEARLLPGLDRTDEPVFNVPRLGKNHLRMWQDHRLLTIRPDGRRVYSFHPWEKNITLVQPYFYVDVSIYDYLQQLAERGEDVRHYRTVWYYY